MVTALCLDIVTLLKNEEDKQNVLAIGMQPTELNWGWSQSVVATMPCHA